MVVYYLGWPKRYSTTCPCPWSMVKVAGGWRRSTWREALAVAVDVAEKNEAKFDGIGGKKDAEIGGKHGSSKKMAPSTNSSDQLLFSRSYHSIIISTSFNHHSPSSLSKRTMSLDSLLHSAVGNNDDDLKFIFVGGKVRVFIYEYGICFCAIGSHLQHKVYCVTDLYSQYRAV